MARRVDIDEAREYLTELLDAAHEMIEDEDLDGNRVWDYWPMDTWEHSDVLNAALDRLEELERFVVLLERMLPNES